MADQVGYDGEALIKTKPDSLTNQGLPGIRCKGMEKIMIFKLGIDVANDAAENVRDT